MVPHRECSLFVHFTSLQGPKCWLPRWKPVHLQITCKHLTWQKPPSTQKASSSISQPWSLILMPCRVKLLTMCVSLIAEQFNTHPHATEENTQKNTHTHTHTNHEQHTAGGREVGIFSMNGFSWSKYYGNIVFWEPRISKCTVIKNQKCFWDEKGLESRDSLRALAFKSG